MSRTDIRIALPSKGALQQGTFDFLENCGLKVYRPNPRQYVATIPALPTVNVMFQRPGDIVAGVREGTIDFGITGWDIVAGRQPSHVNLERLVQTDIPLAWSEQTVAYGGSQIVGAAGARRGR